MFLYIGFCRDDSASYSDDIPDDVFLRWWDGSDRGSCPACAWCGRPYHGGERPSCIEKHRFLSG